MSFPSFDTLQRLLKMERDADRQQYHSQMIQTPLSERKTKGWSWYPVRLAGSDIGLGEQYQLSLERPYQADASAFQVGGRVSIFHLDANGVAADTLPGVIVALWKDRMRVALSVEELPDWLDEPRLGVDMLFDDLTYQEMETALEQVIRAKEGRLAELRATLTGQKPASFAAEVPHYYHIATLNESQNEALRQVLAAKDVALVHGPPGTGKTTTLVEAIKLTLDTEKQVLVCAPSNTAVDLLTLRLAQKGLRVLRIGNPARIDEDLVQYSLDAQLSAHDDYRYLKQLRKQADEYRRMAGKYKRKFGKDEREQRQLLYTEARKISEDAQALEKYMLNDLLQKAQVITATLVGSVNKYIRAKQFSTVFIDEAGQALEPACWIPIQKSERVIFAGDHRQLPPTVKSFEAAQQGLSRTLFERLMHTQPEASALLRTQYRMHEQVMQFSNEQFYEGKLIADENVAQHSLLSPEAEPQPILSQAVSFIDTAGCGFEEQQNPKTRSRANQEEAQLLLRHLTQLIQALQWTPKGQLKTDFSIGIISPYAAQVELLQQLLAEDSFLQGIRDFVQISSIDGFQGQERDIIYLSLVRSNEDNEIGFLSDTRRMNVALTRARKRLVVIGDSATIGGHSFYEAFLNYVERIGAYQSAWEYMA
ncbi:AAA domain-containing protein [Eisenibacter elegans]|uniref:AAA domain-containing protein n=1 Tax=Eisenibacter elegans TaxID=997 RepID=UPI0004182F01|nr:AAA domain-containing protein [Eisenibacter elegans]